MLTGPAQAQLVIPPLAPLVIPPTTGPAACTQGGASEDQSIYGDIIETPTNDSLTFNIVEIPLVNSFTVYAGVQEGGRGAPQQVKNLGSSQPLATQSGTFSGLKKNTRYTFVLYNDATQPYANPLARHCFKTRGEFTPAEQNLVYDNDRSEWQPNLAQYNRTGCYAVASTRQDIRDCYCNGTRNGTHILAGQTTASQAQRQYLNCPDLDS